jgi:hypothetical protein
MSTTLIIPSVECPIRSFPITVFHKQYSISTDEPITISCNSTNSLIKISYLLENDWIEYTGPYILNANKPFAAKFDVEAMDETNTIEFINLSDNNAIITYITFNNLSNI